MLVDWVIDEKIFFFKVISNRINRVCTSDILILQALLSIIAFYIIWVMVVLMVPLLQFMLDIRIGTSIWTPIHMFMKVKTPS